MSSNSQFVSSLVGNIQTTTTAQAPSVERMEKAKRLMRICQADTMVDGVLIRTLDAFSQAIGISEVAKTEVTNLMVEKAPLFLEKIQEVFYNQFDDEELDGLVAFFESKIGQRYIGKQNMIALECQRIGQAWGENLQTEVEAIVSRHR